VYWELCQRFGSLFEQKNYLAYQIQSRLIRKKRWGFHWELVWICCRFWSTISTPNPQPWASNTMMSMNTWIVRRINSLISDIQGNKEVKRKYLNIRTDQIHLVMWGRSSLICLIRDTGGIQIHRNTSQGNSWEIVNHLDPFTYYCDNDMISQPWITLLIQTLTIHNSNTQV